MEIHTPWSNKLTDSKLEEKRKVNKKASMRNTGKIYQILSTLEGYTVDCFFLTQTSASRSL